MSRIRDEEKGATDPKEVTKSWQLIRRLPKGALLRAHCHSLVDLDHLLEAALRTPGMHISCPDGHLATEERRRHGGLRIQYRSKADSEGCSPWAHDYNPETCVPLAEAADKYPEGGREGFIEWIKGRCLAETSESGSGILSGVLYYEPIWRASLRRLITSLVEDGIRWLELR